MKTNRRKFLQGLGAAAIAAPLLAKATPALSDTVTKLPSDVAGVTKVVSPEMDHTADASSYYGGDQWDLRQRQQMEMNIWLRKKVDEAVQGARERFS